MDGTLLDLAFDNYFWQKLVPETWGAKNGVTPQKRSIHASNITTQQHTLNWHRSYYWSEQLGLDILRTTTTQTDRVPYCVKIPFRFLRH